MSAHEQNTKRYVWYVVILLSLVNVFNYMDRMALAVLAPLVKVDLELSDTQLGVLIGFSFSLFYAICGIPIARWADRGIRRDIIAIALATWSVMTASSGAAQNFWQLFIARMGVGAGEAGAFAPGSSIICDYVPLKRRSGAFAIHTFGVYVGMLIGLSLGGWLGDTIGWRWAFVALGLPGVVLAIVLRLSLREPPRGYFDPVSSDVDSRMSIGAVTRVLRNCRTYRFLVLMMVVTGFVQYGLSQWWPSFYARIHGFSMSLVGAYLGVGTCVGSGVGLLIGGLLANNAAQRDVRFPLLIGAAAALLALPAAVGAVFVPTAVGSMLLVSVTSMLCTVSQGPVLAAMYSLTMPQMRATAGAIAIFLTSVLGFGLGPFCVGFLSDVLAPSLGTEALRYALLGPIAFMPLIAVSLFSAARSLVADLRAAGIQVEGGSAATESAGGGSVILRPSKL